MVKEHITENFVSKGMIADCCYHDKGDGNRHVHILLTVRPINLDGTWGDKQRKEYILGYRTKRVDGLIPFNKRSVIIM